MTSATWHGTKKCAVSGAKIPRGQQMMGAKCPWCGNTQGAEMRRRQRTPTLEQQLAKLEQLHADGVITDDELAERRAAAIDKDVVNPSPPSQSRTPATPIYARKSTPGLIESIKKNPLATGAVAIAAVTIVGISLWSSLNDDASAPSSPQTPAVGSFIGRVVDYFPENPAALVVVIEMTNRGNASDNWECTVSASDSSGAYHGFDILSSQEPLGTGQTDQYSGSIIITNEGAAFVTEVELTDCGPE